MEKITNVKNKEFLKKGITNGHEFLSFHQMLEQIIENSLMYPESRSNILQNNSYKNEYNKPCFPSFEYQVYNKDGSLRKISIPNPVKYAEFVDKTLNNLDYFINVYSQLSRTKVAFIQSQFINEAGELCDCFDYYGLDFSVDKNDEGYYLHDNVPYIKSKKKELELSIKYRYKLKLDISNYFSSIYTHIFERIAYNVSYILNESPTKSNLEYIKYLDRYNQAINNSETNGIIVGPFSSKICSEVLLTYVDLKLTTWILDNNIEVEYVRFVDDYTFFAHDYRVLESVELKFNEYLDEVRLKQNYKKRELHESVIISNVRLNKINKVVDNFINSTIDNIYEFDYEELFLYEFEELMLYMENIIKEKEFSKLSVFLNSLLSELENRNHVIYYGIYKRYFENLISRHGFTYEIIAKYINPSKLNINEKNMHAIANVESRITNMNQDIYDSKLFFTNENWMKNIHSIEANKLRKSYQKIFTKIEKRDENIDDYDLPF